MYNILTNPKNKYPKFMKLFSEKKLVKNVTYIQIYIYIYTYIEIYTYICNIYIYIYIPD